MNLRVNGELVKVPSTITTVSGLMDHFQMKNPIVIVEQNDTILDKKDHANAKVADGDKIEFVQFVGGG